MRWRLVSESVYVYMYVHVYVQAHVYVYVYVCVYVYEYVYVYTLDLRIRKPSNKEWDPESPKFLRKLICFRNAQSLEGAGQ